MADINTPAPNRRPARRTVKKSTRTDLTPMVDLGFLLITFFIFTTTLATPKSIKLRIPAETGLMPADGKRLLTIIADSTGACYSYEAYNPEATFKIHHYEQPESIRQTIIAKKAAMKEAAPANPYIMVSIKSLPGATYGAFTALIDEVKINGIRNYHIGNVQKDELLLLELYKNRK